MHQLSISVNLCTFLTQRAQYYSEKKQAKMKMINVYSKRNGFQISKWLYVIPANAGISLIIES